MDHEAFLTASYFAAGAICAGIGWSVWRWLRGSIEALAGMLPPHLLKSLAAKAFPSSAILAALSGFMSVDYYSCGSRTYAEVVTDRAWMLQCNQEQFARAAARTADIVCFWVLIVSIIAIAIRLRHDSNG